MSKDPSADALNEVKSKIITDAKWSKSWVPQ